MNIELHIGELVLEGFDHLDQAEVGAAVERELTRLLAERGVPAAWQQRREGASLPGGHFTVAPGAGSREVGAQIASQMMRAAHERGSR